MKKYFLFSFIGLFFIKPVFTQVLTVSTLATGLSRPVVITNSGLPNDNRLFVCEKVGRIRIVDRITGVVNPVPFLDITSRVYSSGNEQGLIGLAFHPNYASNGYFYVFYNWRVNTVNFTRLARYQVSAFADTAKYVSEQIMMTVFHPFANHNGGNLMFGKDGYLYVSMGDGGSGGDPGNRAQNCDSLLGKILRLDVSNTNPPYYYSPSGNPFYGGKTPVQTFQGILPGRDEIFEWGMRNPWRCSIDRMTGDKWIADVGQNVQEEIDFEARCDSSGHNYGWKCFEGTSAYSTASCQISSAYTQPIFTYSHGSDCSVTGGYVYRGGREGAMFGKYFFTDYCSGKIWETHRSGASWITNLVTQTNALNTNRYNTWGEDIYGELYLAGDGTSGLIYKIADTACAPTAHINAPDTFAICSSSPLSLEAIFGTGLSYTWTVNGGTISGGQGTNTVSIATGITNMTVQVSVFNGTCSVVSNLIYVNRDASFTGLNATYCLNDAVVTLTTLTGGSLSGPGISGNTFDPAVAGAGTHKVTYTSANNFSKCYYNMPNCLPSYTQNVTVELCTGIEEENNIYAVGVYPNPNNSEFNIEFSLLQNSEVEMIVTDALGKKVFESKANGNRGKQVVPLNPSLSPGIYFLTLKAGSSSLVSKILVER